MRATRARNINSNKKDLSPEQREELLRALKARFEKNMNRHKGLEWVEVQAKVQANIGLRRTPQKKNKTDDRHTPANVPLRYLIAFVPVVTDIRRFLAALIEGAAELAAVESAWTKAVHLHVTLSSLCERGAVVAIGEKQI